MIEKQPIKKIEKVIPDDKVFKKTEIMPE